MYRVSPKKLAKAEKLKRHSVEIDKIVDSQNDLALELKIANMSDKYNPERLEERSEERRQWFEQKYGPQRKKLLLAKLQREETMYERRND